MSDTSHAGPGDAAGPPRGGTSLGAEPGGAGEDVVQLTVWAPSEDQLVIDVHGELDMLTAPRMRREVVDRLPQPSVVVLCLDGVTFLGTSGLAVLIELREHTQKSGARLALACTERRVLRPLSIAGLHHLFDIHDSVAESLAAV